MRATIRKAPIAIREPSAFVLGPHADLHLWRMGGLGDLIFMEVALRRLKAWYPKRKVILHTRGQYQCLDTYLGVDQIIPHEGRYRDGAGVELNYAVEQHAGRHSLDRVSIWEDVFSLEITDIPVKIDFPRDDFALESLPNVDASKPFLAFMPFTSSNDFASRSLPVHHVNVLTEALSEAYNVVMFDSGPTFPAGLSMSHIVAKPSCDVMTFIKLVASCDTALACDSGGLWVAGAAGIPTVGIFDHVAPWLRTKRFPTVMGLYTRRPMCDCHQHGCCSVTQTDDSPCKFITPDDAISALISARQMSSGLSHPKHWSLYWNKWIREPSVSVQITDGPNRRETEFAIRHALAGIDWHYGEPNDGSTFAWEVAAGDQPTREDALHSLTLLQLPGSQPPSAPTSIRLANPTNALYLPPRMTGAGK